MTPTTRRTFLATTVQGGAAAIIAGAGGWTLPVLADRIPGDDAAFASGRRVGTVPFLDGGTRLEVLTGRGLDGRYRKDLSRITPERLVTPNGRFYVRTRAPAGIDDRLPWRVRVHGLVDAERRVGVERLAAHARPMGVHLLECSGNGAPYGLISAAEWTGFPVAELPEVAGVAPRSRRILISGFDGDVARSRGASGFGASWVFPLDELEQTGGFLATGMNGEPLPKDHGFPLRLVVPGWYGCTCIKWVDRIEYVGDDHPSTAQMREFAGRTHQRGVPRKARDFEAAEIDLAAMPIRVESWIVDEEPVYRVVGIIWGGRQTTDTLAMRLGSRGDYAAVESLAHETNQTWSLWTHTWRPRRPGRYRITLRVNDARIRTRRLDREYYARSVKIDRV